MFPDNLLMHMLAYAAMSALMILPVSAQIQGRTIVVTGPEDATGSVASTQGTRWALLVGIADYPSNEGVNIQKLKAPVKDVNALAELLKTPEKGGFDPDHVFTLTDKNATKRSILMTFNDIKNFNPF